MIQILLGLLLVVGTGCSSLKKQTAERSFDFQRKWARHTIDGLYLGPRLNHKMAPLIFGEYIIQGNAVDGIRAYKKDSGAPVWSRFFDGGVEAGAALSGTTLLFGANDGFFYALDAYTGRTKWSFPIKSEGLGVPTVDGSTVYFVAGNNIVYAVNIESGEQLWFYSQMESASMTVRGVSQPTVVGDSVIVGFSDGSLYSLVKTTGTIQWERKLGGDDRFKDVDAKPLLHGGNIYVPAYDGQLYALDAVKGTTVWSTSDGGFTTPVIQGDTLYTSTSNGLVQALALSSGKKLWSYKVPQGVSGAPVYYRGLIIFGEWQGGLVALDSQTGAEVARYQTGRGVTSVPVIDAEGQRVFVMSADANLFAFELAWRKQSERWEWEKSPYFYF